MAEGICSQCGGLMVTVVTSIKSKPLEGATGVLTTKTIDICPKCEPEKWADYWRHYKEVSDG